MPEIYFHVGMGKVASTYLREAFFPRMQGIYAIPRRKRFDAVSIVKKGEHDKYFLCRALDTNMEEGISDMARAFPETHPIIVLRKPDSWLMSQYRRWVKNGYPGSLQSFLDVEEDNGFWPREELLFMHKIRLLERYFKPRPLVLFYEDLRKDPKAFFDSIAAYTGTTYDFNAIPLAPRHTSHSEEGLVLRRKIRRWFSNAMPRYTRVPVLHWIQRRAYMLWAYFIVWIAKYLPSGWKPKEPFVDLAYLVKVNAFAQKDWDEVVQYAAASNRIH